MKFFLVKPDLSLLRLLLQISVTAIHEYFQLERLVRTFFSYIKHSAAFMGKADVRISELTITYVSKTAIIIFKY